MNAFFETLSSWFSDQETLLAWLALVSLITFIGSLIAVPMIVIQMSSDYFKRTADEGLPRTPWRLARRLLKNVMGYVVLLAGILMLVLPGQGLLTIAIGVSMLDFPGKRALQLKIVRWKGVRVSLDWIREKAGKEPLELPDE